jgi:hypothetical protein
MMAAFVDNRVIDNELNDMVEANEATLPAFDKLLRFFRNARDDPAPFDHPWRCGRLNVGWPARFYLPPLPGKFRPAQPRDAPSGNAAIPNLRARTVLSDQVARSRAPTSPRVVTAVTDRGRRH